jgi:bifunctional DNA-binding transcriptional regulator/antitoxin component of YhaV-PrlF toxin-antitoxin module
MYTATLSIKNQITIPKFLLDMIHAKSGIQFLISEKDDTLTMRPIKTSLVDELAGSMSIPKNKRGVPFEKVREIVAKKVAYDIAHS